MSAIEQVLREFRNELGSEFLATNVVGMDGLLIATEAAGAPVDVEAGAARFAMVMKLAAKVSERMKLGDVDDNLITTDKVFVLTRFLGDGSYFWGVLVSKEATLGVVRLLMREYADRLWQAIPR